MKTLVLAVLAMVSLAACTNNGKKIKVEGTKGEVYYKGEGVTEDDARKLGQFLKENYFTADKGASVQVTKDADAYHVRFVYDKSVFDTLKGAEDAFKALGVSMSKDVFAGKKVNISLANKSMDDFKTINWDEAFAKSLEEPAPSEDNTANGDNSGMKGLTQADFQHETRTDVDFYWKDIDDAEAKTIVDYISGNGAFSGGTAEIYITKEGDRFFLRFPVKSESRNDPAILAELDRVTKQIKDNVFANVPYTFYMTDEKMNTVKAWEY